MVLVLVQPGIWAVAADAHLLIVEVVEGEALLEVLVMG